MHEQPDLLIRILKRQPFGTVNSRRNVDFGHGLEKWEPVAALQKVRRSIRTVKAAIQIRSRYRGLM
jgi:hypothetical protein